jgi:hypothetical protein
MTGGTGRWVVNGIARALYEERDIFTPMAARAPCMKLHHMSFTSMKGAER